jgi:hypothetical protein
MGTPKSPNPHIPDPGQDPHDDRFAESTPTAGNPEEYPDVPQEQEDGSKSKGKSGKTKDGE